MSHWLHETMIFAFLAGSAALFFATFGWVLVTALAGLGMIHSISAGTLIAGWIPIGVGWGCWWVAKGRVGA